MLAGEVHHFLFCFFSNTNQLMAALCEGSDSEEEGEELAGAGRVPGLGFSDAWELGSGRKRVCREGGLARSILIFRSSQGTPHSFAAWARMLGCWRWPS